MSTVKSTQTVHASVLDRLLDDDPGSPHDDSATLYDVRALKQSVARDLEALLNTRTAEFDKALARYPLARNSILGYGVSDLSSISLLNPDDRARLRAELTRAIEQFEPRLKRVSVGLEEPRELERMLRFRVDAVLSTHPSRPPVSFDATLQLSTKVYRVKDLLNA
jgi:type VI secretion system protein ImpF